MHFLLLALLLLALLFGPQLWARHTLQRHSKPRPDFPGSGGQLARHLLDRYQLHHVQVESTDHGDHYDPLSKTVRLSPQIFDGRSLTAVAVAAHEVGHALQDHSAYAPLAWRGRLVELAQWAEKAGSAIMMVLPVVALLSRSPAAGGAVFLLGLATMATATVVHLITLPVEFDASFGRALPILTQGEYIERKDERAARAILRACALTYVAGSLASLLNLWRWLRLWRR